MKSAGLVSLCTAIALSGLYLSYLQSKRLGFIRELCSFFSDMAELGRTGFSDFRGAFTRLCDIKKYKELQGVIGAVACCGSGENLREIWDGAVRFSCPFYVNCVIKNLLFSFSDVFGRCTREIFVMKCTDFLCSARTLLDAEEKRYEKNRSLTVYSGVLTAAAVFFILY